MAYPMEKWPTFGELVERLERDFDCQYIRTGEILVNGLPVGWIERSLNGSTKRFAVIYDSEFRLAPSAVRGICANLNIDVKMVLPGFTLG